MTLEERMAMIDAKVQKDETKRRKAKETLDSNMKRLQAQIEELRPRIEDLMKLATYAAERDINISHFYTDCIYHRLGFYQTSPIQYIGYKAGGACGEWNFATNGQEIFEYNGSIFDDRRAVTNLGKLESFLKDFPIFEQQFYSYIDSKCQE